MSFCSDRVEWRKIQTSNRIVYLCQRSSKQVCNKNQRFWFVNSLCVGERGERGRGRGEWKVCGGWARANNKHTQSLSRISSSLNRQQRNNAQWKDCKFEVGIVTKYTVFLCTPGLVHHLSSPTICFTQHTLSLLHSHSFHRYLSKSCSTSMAIIPGCGSS